jgi:hypothetical protein
MSRVRFTTAQSLFETFPELAAKSTLPPGDDPPVAFLEKLSAQQKYEEAVAFCAHLLPRREAVWWACGCVRMLLGEIPQHGADCLLAAEAWVHDPSEELRKAAQAIGNAHDGNNPLSWLARAAGWAGGLLHSNQNAPPAPPYLTARAARIAVLLSANGLRPAEKQARLRTCIMDGIKLTVAGP